MKNLACLLVASILFFTQLTFAGHSHEHGHDHDVPERESCHVCIIAVQDEGEFDLTWNYDDDPHDLQTLAVPQRQRAKSNANIGLNIRFTGNDTDISYFLKHQTDPARAPPFII